MDGWMDGRMDGWIEGWMDVWMDEFDAPSKSCDQLFATIKGAGGRDCHTAFHLTVTALKVPLWSSLLSFRIVCADGGLLSCSERAQPAMQCLKNVMHG